MMNPEKLKSVWSELENLLVCAESDVEQLSVLVHDQQMEMKREGLLNCPYTRMDARIMLMIFVINHLDSLINTDLMKASVEYLIAMRGEEKAS